MIKYILISLFHNIYDTDTPLDVLFHKVNSKRFFNFTQHKNLYVIMVIKKMQALAYLNTQYILNKCKKNSQNHIRTK